MMLCSPYSTEVLYFPLLCLTSLPLQQPFNQLHYRLQRLGNSSKQKSSPSDHAHISTCQKSQFPESAPGVSTRQPLNQDSCPQTKVFVAHRTSTRIVGLPGDCADDGLTYLRAGLLLLRCTKSQHSIGLDCFASACGWSCLARTCSERVGSNCLVCQGCHVLLDEPLRIGNVPGGFIGWMLIIKLKLGLFDFFRICEPDWGWVYGYAQYISLWYLCR